MANLGLINRNPGNLKDPKTGAFRSFNTPDEGFKALTQDLEVKKSGHSPHIKPGQSIQELASVWAPESDNNKPSDWADNVSKFLGVPTAYAFDQVPTERLAKAIQVAEGTSDLKTSGFSGNPKVSEFAHKLKTKYPQYNDIGDEELTQKILAKYPQYNDMVGESQGAMDMEKPYTPVEENPKEQGLGEQLAGRAHQASGALEGAASGKINPLSGLLQVGGAAGGAIGDVTNKALEFIPGYKQLTGVVGEGAKALANTGLGQSAISSYEGLSPEVRGNIEAAGNIATAIPILKGVGAIKSAIGGAFEKGALSGIAADIAPELGAKGTAKTTARQGLVKTTLSGEVKPVLDAGTKEVADTVAEFVPNFQKLPTFTDKLNATRDAVYKLADELKHSVLASGEDRIYSYRELASEFGRMEKPLLITAENLDNAYERVIAKALEIAKAKGGKISSLFDARKEFDDFVSQTFPNLYSSDKYTGMRQAIRNVRGTMNDFVEKRLPKNVNFKKSLRSQSKLFEAVENLSPKASKEIGTTRWSRFKGRHPGLVNTGRELSRAGLTGLGLSGAYAGYQTLKGE